MSIPAVIGHNEMGRSLRYTVQPIRICVNYNQPSGLHPIKKPGPRASNAGARDPRQDTLPGTAVAAFCSGRSFHVIS